MLNVYHYHTAPKTLLHHKITRNADNIHDKIPTEMMTYPEALEYIESLNTNGDTGWRLPTVSEMQSLLAEAVSPGTQIHHRLPIIDVYWTSEPGQEGGIHVVFPFDDGGADVDDLDGFFEWADIDDLSDVEVVDEEFDAYAYPVRGKLEPFTPVSQRY